MTLKEMLELKEILGTDSLSTTRLTTNSNFKQLKKAIVALIDSLAIDESSDLVVDSLETTTVVANSLNTPKPLGGTYNFTVNSNGEVVCKSILSNVVMQTARLRLNTNSDTDAFQQGEIRWNGSDWVGWDGSTWVSLTSKNEPFGETNTGSNVGTGSSVFKVKNGVDLQFRTIQAGSGITLTQSTNEILIDGVAQSGYSGFSGYSGMSGFSGSIGLTGNTGSTGTSGFSGVSGFSGQIGASGFSGVSGIGTSGFSGVSGYSGKSGFSGTNGSTGTSGFSGFSGYSGVSGTNGQVSKYRTSFTAAGGGTPDTITHSLHTTDIVVQVWRISTGALVDFSAGSITVDNKSPDTVDITLAGSAIDIEVIVLG